MAKLDSLKGSVQVFFTDEGTGGRYRAFPDGTYIFVKSPQIEARMKGVLDAQGIDYADEPKPLDRDIYGIDLGRIQGTGKLLHALVQVLGDDSTEWLTSEQKKFLRNTQDAVGSTRW